MGGGPGAAPPSFLLSDAWKAEDTTYRFIDIHHTLGSPRKARLIRNEEAQQIASTPRFSYCGGLSTRTTSIKASDICEVCKVIGRLSLCDWSCSLKGLRIPGILEDLPAEEKVLTLQEEPGL